MSKANQKSEIPGTVFFRQSDGATTTAPQERKDMTTAEQSQEALLYVTDLLHMV